MNVISFGFKMTDWITIFDFIPEKYHENYNSFDISIFANHIKIKNPFLVQKLGNGKLEKNSSNLTVFSGCHRKCG